MELFKEIFAQALTDGKIEIVFACKNDAFEKVIEGQCYQALQKIKAIVDDDSLDDPACFMRIEEIVEVLESVGSTGGGRHDFG